ncbi:SPOR domain-containing protein [Sinorhizobium alkalisoli]|uniref:Sporulation protein n=1 Tax=Sinorhizobium alkalisoli TaxID=1752398 RepID=A0A1E3VEH0_9HYPH|nr:SPOR domain-containing protein [Sinorhizobium alkalisoli]MCG5477869.1 SPOR domain-containing protein [Sinorhizobium alkalisoli]ODR91837.1 sporulation protein [Sinorhizobium alkalisoli]
MADKQFARSGPAEFDTLADDDPLSELARIVGYDARPAVQQLQELQRHQESIRRDPAFDLEEELLRAFDSYDAPRAEAVHPDSRLVEHPVAQAAAEPVSGPADEVDAAPPVELHSGSHVPAPDQDSSEVVSLRPASEEVASVEPAVEASVDAEAAPVEPQDESPAIDIDASFDLERELELSLGQDDLAPALAPEPAPAPSEDAAQLTSPFEAEDTPVFADWEEPLASRLNAAGQVPAHGELSEPVYAEAVYVDMADGIAGQHEDVGGSATAVVEQLEDAVSEPDASEHVDRLSDDAAPFAVPADVEAQDVGQPPVLPAAEPVARKSSYPFTPMFSRATPVASAAGVSEQRAFAAPLAPVVAKPPVESVLLPQTAPAVSDELVRSEPVEAEPEPSIDIEDFELQLADIALDRGEEAMGAGDSGEEVAPATVAEAPPVAHPALVEPIAQPFLQALATQAVPETDSQELPGETAGVESVSADNPLPFDPAMIAETDTGVAPIAELDVPQLPHVEVEEKPASFAADYDLDIDAEMAQLFGNPPRATKGGPSAAGPASHADPAGDSAVSLASINDFDEFEKAMEEDFRRSMEERRGEAQDVDRLAALPRGGDDYAGEEGYGRRSQRSMLLAASVAGFIILGGAGVYAWMGGSSATLTGDGPKIILADKDPVKIVPEEKGGKTVPNQDKAVYDRVAGARSDTPRQDALVSTTEEPVDVVQKTLTPETLPLEGNDFDDSLPGVSSSEGEENARLLPGESAADPAAEEERAPAVMPRKVRTMIVKPDGTLVPREEQSVEPESRAAAVATPLPATASAEAGASGTEGQAAVAVAETEIKGARQPAGSENVALATPTQASTDELTPVRSVKTTTIASEAPAVPQARPEAPAKPAENKAAETQAATETAAADPSAALATATVPPGSYVVQIASLPSEADAQKSYNNLSRKFADVIGGRGVDIRKAEIAGKGTYYRVRIPAGTREEANALCARYKSAGGSCLVTK